MKIIHTADLHLGSKMEVRLDSTKSKKRKNELIITFEKLIEKAKELQVKVIIIAGDMFDTKEINNKTKDYILGLFNKNLDIDFIYTSGNHDEINFFNKVDLPKNVFLCNNEWSKFSYEDVDIWGINFNSYTSKFLYDTLNVDLSKKNIVVLHGQVSNSNQEGIINIKKLMNKGIDYLALGHIHTSKVEKLDDRGIYAYSGTLEGRGFDELGEKGFLLIDSNTINNPVFFKHAKRTLREVRIDISNFNSWLEIENEVNSSIKDFSNDDMIRVRLVGYFDVSLIKQTDILLEKLNSKFFFASIKDESLIKINVDDYKNEVSLKSEFIKNVMSLNDDENKDAILEYGLKALLGEEI